MTEIMTKCIFLEPSSKSLFKLGFYNSTYLSYSTPNFKNLTTFGAKMLKKRITISKMLTKRIAGLKRNSIFQMFHYKISVP